MKLLSLIAVSLTLLSQVYATPVPKAEPWIGKALLGTAAVAGTLFVGSELVHQQRERERALGRHIPYGGLHGYGYARAQSGYGYPNSGYSSGYGYPNTVYPGYGGYGYY